MRNAKETLQYLYEHGRIVQHCHYTTIMDFINKPITEHPDVQRLITQHQTLMTQYDVLHASYEKLVNACEKAKWLYDELALSTLGAACKYGDNYQPPTKEDCLHIRELLEQALKNTENQK